ncbi:autotransporter assembly complex family protein [Oleiagrimonas sp. MCCC 1A03011]|uniref:autotransporter assembly complex protein TamA n=1 Tax=Oleiagrimonas sp. MCCC 1A03011 TaxID=1926883 RepID=UPI000DC24E78|nr:autotransporter assembly complex family protein [Oleiagrimonas sp. MCCC 1A03011]RAP59415.1 outer membrane protein assembly factor [Oleiagrimonas sp. MCCC 1A03011]
MRPLSRIVLALLLPLLVLAPLCAKAGVTVRVQGLNDDLKQAVTAAVRLSQYAKRDASAAQVRRLYAKAPDEARQALRPYGYYDARVDADLKQNGADWTVTLKVTPGDPVIVRDVDIQLDDAARKLPDVRSAIRQFKPRKGQRMDDGLYTASRDAIAGALTAVGYLDARMTVHKVEVTRATHSAVVHLAWQVGRRYRFGKVTFEGSQFRDGFLNRYVPFKRGDYFSQPDLLQLQQALTGADYFAVVNVLPDIEHAHDGVVDINVQLKPAKRSVYTGGPFIGTDTGAGVRLGLERRWVNNRGHKWKNELVLAQRLKTLSTLYQVPLPGTNQRSLNFGANYRQADTDTSKSRTLELVASESRLWHGWLRTVGIHALSGTFTVGKRGGDPDNTLGIERGQSTLVYPEISLVKKQGADPNYVRHGWRLSLTARSTLGTVLSDTRFAQVIADAKWIDAFSRRDRLIVRGTAGSTVVGDFSQLPPQLRFFAGGDQSVRGYGYQSIGPRNRYDRIIGGRNLLVGSVTAEHYFTTTWGMAAFVDAGNAFNGSDYRPRIGAGLGVRWRSPVGMIRVDFGVPLHDRNAHGVELHLVIGPDL